MHPTLVLAATHLLVGAAAAAVAVVAWRRRRATYAALGLAISIGGGALWAAQDVAVMLAVYLGAGRTVLMSVVAWILPWSMVSVSGFYPVVRSLRHPDWYPGRRTIALLAVAPLLAAVAAGTNDATHWVVADAHYRDGEWAARWTQGPAFGIFALYAMVISCIGLWMLVAAARNASQLQRQQARAIFVASLVPTLANIAVSIGSRWTPMPDLVGLSFSVSGFVTGYAVLRLGLLKAVPIARGLVLDRIMDAVIVVSADGFVIDANATGRALIRDLAPALPENPIGLLASEVLGGHGLPSPLVTGEYALVLADDPMVYDVRVERIDDDRGHPLGRVIVARDVTELHRRRTDLAAANDRLRQEIATVEQLRSELAEQAVRDELTGLHNRRHLVAALDHELLVARTRGTPLAVVLLDLDHFKAINDTYGHAVGDDVLRAAAVCLRDATRAVDVVARYGGEEFVVLLPGASLESALERVEQWRERLADLVVPSPDGPVRVTTSAGVAVHGLATGDARELLKAADQALYAAKAAGRNRVLAATA